MLQKSKNMHQIVLRQIRKREAGGIAGPLSDGLRDMAAGEPAPRSFGVFRGLLFCLAPAALFWILAYCLWRALRGG